MSDDRAQDPQFEETAYEPPRAEDVEVDTAPSATAPGMKSDIPG